jgi:hypothetical protein
MKILILSFFLLPFSFLFSQGNLQFNQVLSYTGTISCNGINTYCSANSPSSYTVPANKVWKLESAGFSSSLTNPSSPDIISTYLIINNTYVYGGPVNRGTFQPKNGILITSPVWLKSGDVLSWGMSSACLTNYISSASMHLSIIEFNIIP